MILGEPQWFRGSVQDLRVYCRVLTYLPQLDGTLKLLSSNNEQNSQIDTRVESWLELKTFPIPRERKTEGERGRNFILIIYSLLGSLLGDSASVPPVCSLGPLGFSRGKLVDALIVSVCVCLTTGWRCLCSWCLYSQNRERCPCRSVHTGRTCLEPGGHMTVTPVTSHLEPALCPPGCSSYINKSSVSS